MHELTERAVQYLATLERVPAEHDEESIRAALSSAGLPPLDAVIDFQVRFGGYVTYDCLNRFEWGILHRIPADCSCFSPNEVNYFEEDDDFFISCCNCHGSDHWYMNSKGEIHWCFRPPLASSFQTLVERDALCWNLDQLDGGLRRIKFDESDEEVLRVLMPRIRRGIVAEASDEYETLILYDGVYASVKDGEVIACLTEGNNPAPLQGIAFSLQ